MIYYSNNLAHHGVKGQKWGVRRYQNEDGSYKPGAEGRYNTDPDGNLTKRGERQAQRGINRLNKAKDKYSKLGNKWSKRNPSYYNEMTGNTIQINDNSKKSERLEKKIDKAYARMEKYMSRSMESMKSTNYSVGYDFVKDHYYLREVSRDGKDHWQYSRVNI